MSGEFKDQSSESRIVGSTQMPTFADLHWNLFRTFSLENVGEKSRRFVRTKAAQSSGCRFWLLVRRREAFEVRRFTSSRAALQTLRRS
jgi:hypothetical protein